MKHTGGVPDLSADADVPVLDLSQVDDREGPPTEDEARSFLAKFSAWAQSHALAVARQTRDHRARALWLALAFGRSHQVRRWPSKDWTGIESELTTLAFVAFVAAAALEAQRANDDRHPEPTRLPPPPPLQDVHILAAPAPANAPPAGDLPTLREVAT